MIDLSAFRLAVAGLVLAACCLLLLSRAHAAPPGAQCRLQCGPVEPALLATLLASVADERRVASTHGGVAAPVVWSDDSDGAVHLHSLSLHSLYELLGPLLLRGDGLDVGLTANGVEAGLRLRL